MIQRPEFLGLLDLFCRATPCNGQIGKEERQTGRS
jgi:hypothetical protein